MFVQTVVIFTWLIHFINLHDHQEDMCIQWQPGSSCVDHFVLFLVERNGSGVELWTLD